MTHPVRADAMALPLRDESVDLIITSPPYFAQRSYKDGGEHYDGQVGSEPHPDQFLEALWAVAAECWRVLKPSGSMFVNLGDKRTGSGAPGTTSGLGSKVQGARSGITGSFAQRGLSRSDERNARSYDVGEYGRAKSKMMLPHRFAIGCEDGRADPDGVGWIMRQDQVWAKPNGLPESVTDRTRDSHEYWFHLTREGDYYDALDELREPYSEDASRRRELYAERLHDRAANDGYGGGDRNDADRATVMGVGPDEHPLGAMPRSVWTIPTEPLLVPDYVVVQEAGGYRGQWCDDTQARAWMDSQQVLTSPWPRPADGTAGPFLLATTEHFAAFPTEWPRRLILGWSPPAICLECGEGRKPVVRVDFEPTQGPAVVNRYTGAEDDHKHNWTGNKTATGRNLAVILGYSCACTPRTRHDGRQLDEPRTGPTGAVPPGAMPRQGRGAVGRMPRVGAWTEYHLEGWTPPPSRPAVVLDPFGGTGTTAMVARALGRVGVSVDLSADYTRLAAWRIDHHAGGRKAAARTAERLQTSLL